MVGRTEVKSKLPKKEVGAGDKDEKKPTRSFRKSPARTQVDKSPVKSRPKSPAPVTVNSTSPSRRGRPRSPGRKTAETPTKKSPSRKSPGRRPAISSKSPSRRERKASTPPPPPPPKKVVVPVKSIELDSASDSEQSEKSEVSRTSSYKLRLRKTPLRDNVEISNHTVTRRSSSRTQERVVHLKANYEPHIKLTEFSDEDEISIPKVPDTPVVQRKRNIDFKSNFSALFHMLCIPVILFGMLILCNDLECAFKIPEFKRFSSLSAYFDLTVFLFYTSYVLLIAILSILPFGGKKCSGLLNKSGKLDYTMNGLFSAFVVLAILCVMEFYHLQVFNFIQSNFVKLAASSFVTAIPIASALYVKSRRAPVANLTPNALTKPHLYNFFYGSELNPRFRGNFDVKIFLMRTGIISLLVLVSTFIYQGLNFSSVQSETDMSKLVDNLKSLDMNFTLLTICTLFMIYCIDFLLFEHNLLSTLEVQHESLGYMKCVECLSFAVLYAIIPKYVLDFNVQLKAWQLIFSVLLFVIGYCLYRGSNTQKHAFRENPYSPAVAHLESIPTSTGRKLLCSGFWGFVRHPNYLGDILINISYLPFVLCSPPCIILYSGILHLVQRASKDNVRCRGRYGSSWERYCQRVKYILVPKVY